MYICLYIHTYLYIYVYIYTPTHKHINVYIYIYVCHIYTCHIYTHTYTCHIYTHTYIYKYTYMCICQLCDMTISEFTLYSDTNVCNICNRSNLTKCTVFLTRGKICIRNAWSKYRASCG